MLIIYLKYRKIKLQLLKNLIRFFLRTDQAWTIKLCNISEFTKRKIGMDRKDMKDMLAGVDKIWRWKERIGSELASIQVLPH
jgi:hypothetical protein